MLPVVAGCHAQSSAVRPLLEDFSAAYAALDPEPFALDLRERLAAVPPDSVLVRQEAAFKSFHAQLSGVKDEGTTAEEGCSSISRASRPRTSWSASPWSGAGSRAEGPCR
ncbi:MAG: hypothetical protein IPH53_21630 [Flavobacteriales bacterium]|nr:hypothetical protein [Flavobacteriales bacterium]